MSYGFQPQYNNPPPEKGGCSLFVWILVILLGGGVALTCVCCGGMAHMLSNSPTVTAQSREPFNVASVQPPVFPERGAAMMLQPGIDMYRINLGPPGGFPATPGQGGSLWLYLPAGNHAPKSLPCVLITGAGTTLLHGLEWGDLFQDGGSPEHLPYVRAGYAVVAYELDGPFDQDAGQNDAEMKRAYVAFRAAQAGLVNARNALEFTLARVPEVNPNRIYSAGHSSAGTLSMLFAEHEPRLAGCIAYAPCIDLTERLTPMVIRTMSLMLPELADFAVKSSPKTHEIRLNCPLFLFHADDDSNVPCGDSRFCEMRLKGLGKKVTLVTVPTGNHYQSMIDQGIPRAIEWLNNGGGK